MKQKYYWTDLGNLEYWVGGMHYLSEEKLKFFEFEEGELVKVYGEDVIADGIFTRDRQGRYMIVIISEAENLDDEIVEFMDGAFANGERFGQTEERDRIVRKMKSLGFSAEDIQCIVENNR